MGHAPEPRGASQACPVMRNPPRCTRGVQRSDARSPRVGNAGPASRDQDFSCGRAGMCFQKVLAYRLSNLNAVIWVYQTMLGFSAQTPRES